MIPDFAIAMLSKEPPRAAICSSPIDVITAAASPVLSKTFVASRAPPRPAYNKEHRSSKFNSDFIGKMEEMTGRFFIHYRKEKQDHKLRGHAKGQKVPNQRRGRFFQVITKCSPQ